MSYYKKVFVPAGVVNIATGTCTVRADLYAMRLCEDVYKNWSCTFIFPASECIRVRVAPGTVNSSLCDKGKQNAKTVHKLLCNCKHTHQTGERRGEEEGIRCTHERASEPLLYSRWSPGLYSPGIWSQADRSDDVECSSGDGRDEETDSCSF